MDNIIQIEIEIQNLTDSRLKDYYRAFVDNHEKVIRNFKIDNYPDMPMRRAVDALCKLLFHEVRNDADSFYIQNGPNGSRFSLSSTNDSEADVFYFSNKDKVAGRKKRKDINKTNDILPQGEILQIGAALAEKLKYRSNDSRYTEFVHVHQTVYQYESNDKEHVSANQDKAHYTLQGRINDYESFVHKILSMFEKELTIKLAGSISTASESDYGKFKQEEAEQHLIVSETTKLLIDQLNNTLGSEYLTPLVLFVPAQVDCRLLHALARINWNLIITFDPEGHKEGHVISVIKQQWNGKRPFKIDNITSDGREETAIFFANGDSPLTAKTKYGEWKKTYLEKVKNALTKIRKGSEGVYAVCIPDNDDNKIFNRGGVGLLDENDTLIIVGKIATNLKEVIQEDISIRELQEYDIPISQTINAFNEIAVPEHRNEIFLNSGLSQEDISMYASYGIKVICPIPVGTEKAQHPISDFFCGKDITEQDLYNDFDVRRSEYEKLRKVIEERLKNGIRFTHYLKQTPTCGATTLAMRLAYDMANLNTKIDLNSPITSIFISEFKTEDTNDIIRRIKDLALRVSPNQILAFIDRSIQEKDFDRVKETLTDGGSVKISFIRISQNEVGSGRAYATQIKDRLTKAEQVDFERAYRRYASATGDHSTCEWNDMKYVIEYPISLNHTDERNLKINEYLEAALSEFKGANSQIIKKILSLIGFCGEHIVNTDNYVEGCLFDGIVGKRFTDWYSQNLTRSQKNAFERLIKFEEEEHTRKRTGRVKTRFSKFNQVIVALSNESFTDLAVEYISIFFSEPALSEKYVEDYIINMFFKKEDYEEENINYTGKSDVEKFYKKLSAVFNKIKDTDSISIIFDELGKHIEDHPRYLLSKAQYIYNRAYFVDSEEHDSKIFDEARDILESLLKKENVGHEYKSVTYQSLGVLNYRRLGALRKYEIKEDALKHAHQYVEDIVRYCDFAYDDNPSDTHSIVTKAQALKSYLNMTKSYLNSDNFEFCESNEYVDWAIQYESAVESIYGYIVNLDKNNTTASQNELLKIYENLKNFSFKLIGLSDKELYNHYKSKLESRQIGNAHKTLYANRLYNVLIEAPNSEIRSDKMSILTDDKLSFIEEQLRSSIRLGNLSGYEKIFRLHLFGRKDYAISKEIQWLKNWMEKDNNPYSQLWCNYYLGVLYLSEILRQGYDSKGYYRSAMKYLNLSVEFAKILKRNDTKEHFYFRMDEGLKSVTDSATKATFMEGRIKKIEDNRKGVAELDCGLEATFSPKGEFFMDDADKQTRIRAKVGFRFSGLGLYGVERIENLDAIDEQKIIGPRVDSQDFTQQIDTTASAKTYNQSLINKAQNLSVHTTEAREDVDEYGLEEGYIYYGTYHKNKYSGPTITGDWKEHWIKYLTIEGSIDDDIYDGDEVEFSIKKKVNPHSGPEKWIAFDVKHPEY